MRHKILLVLGLILGVLSIQARADEPQERSKRSSRNGGWLGVSIQDVTPRFARDHELKVNEGAYIAEVLDDSPADSAGLREGDVVTEFNTKKIEMSEDLSDAVRSLAPGTAVPLTVVRKGETKKLTATIGSMKRRRSEAFWMPGQPRIIINAAERIAGMDLMELNDQLAKYFNAPDGGVLVKQVEKNSSAEKAGIMAGDVITKIGKESVEDIGDIRDAVSDLDDGATADIAYIRKGKSSMAKLTVSGDEENAMWQHRERIRIPEFDLRFPEFGDDARHDFDMYWKHIPDVRKNLRELRERIREVRI